VPKLIVKTETVEDGEFPLELSHGEYTMEEYATMSRICGAYGLEIFDQFWKDHGPAIVAVAVVNMQRAGRTPDVGALLRAKRSCFTFDISDLKAEDGDESPPDQSPSESGSPGETQSEAESSG
jgi:hypothetical protein